jgi:hypothetical protein
MPNKARIMSLPRHYSPLQEPLESRVNVTGVIYVVILDTLQHIHHVDDLVVCKLMFYCVFQSEGSC